MEFIIFAILLLLAVASAAGLTADSRDSADWQPRNGGWHNSLRT